MTTPDVRLAAADLIDTARGIIAERGLSESGPVDNQDRVCTVHACTLAGGARYAEAWCQALDTIRQESGCRGLGRWSDASSYEDVVLTLKRAAYSLREAAL